LIVSQLLTEERRESLSIIIIIIINLLAQKHDRVTCATKQSRPYMDGTLSLAYVTILVGGLA